VIASNLGILWRRLGLPKRIDAWPLTRRQQRLMKTGGHSPGSLTSRRSGLNRGRHQAQSRHAYVTVLVIRAVDHAQVPHTTPP